MTDLMLTGLPGYDPATSQRAAWAAWRTDVILARLHAARGAWGWWS